MADIQTAITACLISGFWSGASLSRSIIGTRGFFDLAGTWHGPELVMDRPNEQGIKLNTGPFIDDVDGDAALEHVFRFRSSLPEHGEWKRKVSAVKITQRQSQTRHQKKCLQEMKIEKTTSRSWHQLFWFWPALPALARAQAPAEKAAYPAMAPVDQYLMADQDAEIALARSAAPASISDGAEVMVLGRTGIHDRSRRARMVFSALWSGHGAPPPMSGVLESQNPLAHLLQCGGRRTFCADLPDEDQTGASGKVEGGDLAGHHIGTR